MEKFILRYSQVPTNPPIEFAEAMTKQASGSKEVVSIGGGSTIDTGKYVAWKLNIPHTAIPTTAGTGSEVTKFAVFTIGGKKHSFEDEALIPDKYELKPELVVTLPAEQTIASGVDALCHAIESWWSPNATKESRQYAKRSIHLITGCLCDSVKNPDNEYLRGKMLEAANLAGRAINITKTSVCHAISYPLTMRYGISHGIACGMTLPIFMKHFGMRPKTIEKIDRMLKTLGVKKLKMGEDIILDAIRSERFQNTPKPVTKEDLQKLL